MIENVFSWIEEPSKKWFHYVYDLGEAKAYREDPEWKRIEDLRNELSTHPGTRIMSSGDGRLTVQNWFWQKQRVEELTPSIDFWRDVVHAFEKPRQTYRSLQQRIKVLRRGYPDVALFDFWTWHADMVIKVLSHFKNTTMGHPAHMTQGEWEAKINEVIYAFRALRIGGDPLQSDVDDAFNKLSEIYLSLWD